MLIQALNIPIVLLYLLAAVTYTAYFITQKQNLKNVPTLVLLASICFHCVYIIFLAKALGRFPIFTVFEVLTSATFLFAFVYLILEFFIKDKSMGVLIIPILLIFQFIAITGIDTIPKALPPQLEQLSRVTFGIHIIFMMLAYSGFAVAFIASAMHLLLAREIHQKRLGFFFSRIPSLELLNRLNASAASLGFIFATAGMLCGFLMATQYWGNPMPPDPKFISFFLTWVLYLFHLLARRKLGWHGERAAWLSVIGFLWVTVNLFVVSLFLTKLHLYV